MIIKKLQFEGFRNLNDGFIEPHSDVNVIFGANAQGKTNLLEAIWLFSGNRSFRNARDVDFINIDKDFSVIKIDFFSEGRDQTAEIIFNKGKKEIKINGIKQTSASSLMGKIRAVVFSPEHLSLIKNGPSERRKFIDSAICQIKPSYSQALSNYNKILANRNALLKDIPYHSQLLDTLDIWDLRIAAVGASVEKMRLHYVERLCEIAKRYHFGISDGKEEIQIEYNCGFTVDNSESSENIRDIILENLTKSRKSDIKDGFTGFGPHRNDIDIFINSRPVKSFGSQGQQRSCVLSMKIAEAELLKTASDEDPIILLDDVLSELDSKRQEFLLNKISDRQVFISCCEKASVERLSCGRLFKVECGKIRKI